MTTFRIYEVYNAGPVCGHLASARSTFFVAPVEKDATQFDITFEDEHRDSVAHVCRALAILFTEVKP